MIKFVLLLLIVGVVSCGVVFFFGIILPELIEFYLPEKILTIWDTWIIQIIYYISILWIEVELIINFTKVAWQIFYT